MVDFVVISAEVGVRKPDPRIFEEALRRAGVAAGEAVHVGDLPEEDIEGARRAGLGAFLIDREKRITSRDCPEGVPVLGTLGDLLQRV
jgi:putative hydrolase of the HAD superfamily